MDSKEQPSDLDSNLELLSKFNCDGCSLFGSSSNLETTFAELYSHELDIASYSVQEHWQVSAAHIVF